MSLKFNVNFKWNRDEAFEAMHDDALDQLASELVARETTMTCAKIRAIEHELRGKNEMMALETLKTFMKQDLDGIPRFVRYVQEISEYGLYMDHPDLEPSRSQAFLDSVKISSEFFGLEVAFEIPDEFRIPNWEREDYVTAMDSFKRTLADGMWGGPPGSTAVHHSYAVVDFDAW